MDTFQNPYAVQAGGAVLKGVQEGQDIREKRAQKQFENSLQLQNNINDIAKTSIESKKIQIEMERLGIPSQVFKDTSLNLHQQANVQNLAQENQEVLPPKMDMNAFKFQPDTTDYSRIFTEREKAQMAHPPGKETEKKNLQDIKDAEAAYKNFINKEAQYKQDIMKQYNLTLFQDAPPNVKAEIEKNIEPLRQAFIDKLDNPLVRERYSSWVQRNPQYFEQQVQRQEKIGPDLGTKEKKSDITLAEQYKIGRTINAYLPYISGEPMEGYPQNTDIPNKISAIRDRLNSMVASGKMKKEIANEIISGLSQKYIKDIEIPVSRKMVGF